MKKSDLKTGMLVVDTAGAFGIVMKDTEQGDAIVGSWDRNNTEPSTSAFWTPLDSYDEDLKGLYGNITKVYGFLNNCDACLPKIKHRKLLWERKEYKLELTTEYTAVVDKENKVVRVGCQTIPFEKVEELIKIINNDSTV